MFVIHDNAFRFRETLTLNFSSFLGATALSAIPSVDSESDKMKVISSFTNGQFCFSEVLYIGG